MRMQVPTPSSLSGLRIWRCCKHGIGHKHGSDLAQASSGSPDSTPSQLPHAADAAPPPKKTQKIYLFKASHLTHALFPVCSLGKSHQVGDLEDSWPLLTSVFDNLAWFLLGHLLAQVCHHHHSSSLFMPHRPIQSCVSFTFIQPFKKPVSPARHIKSQHSFSKHLKALPLTYLSGCGGVCVCVTDYSYEVFQLGI